MTETSPDQWRPPWLQLPLETRVFFEYLRMPTIDVGGNDWPTGENRPVMVIPGFGQGANSTKPLRKMLEHQGFTAHDWALGRNAGMKSGMTKLLLNRLENIKQECGQAPALVGWSLGGVFARELARKNPQTVSHVISLGSPIAGGHSTTLQAMLGLLKPKAHAEGHDPQRYMPPPVPCTAIYSRSDGVVNWRAAREPDTANTENIQVRGSHMGLGFNPRVWHIICHRLSPQTRDQTYAH